MEESSSQWFTSTSMHPKGTEDSDLHLPVFKKILAICSLKKSESPFLDNSSADKELLDINMQ